MYMIENILLVVILIINYLLFYYFIYSNFIIKIKMILLCVIVGVFFEFI